MQFNPVQCHLEPRLLFVMEMWGMWLQAECCRVSEGRLADNQQSLHVGFYKSRRLENTSTPVSGGSCICPLFIVLIGCWCIPEMCFLDPNWFEKVLFTPSRHEGALVPTSDRTHANAIKLAATVKILASKESKQRLLKSMWDLRGSREKLHEAMFCFFLFFLIQSVLFFASKPQKCFVLN